MYIRVKCRKCKNDERVAYLYLCDSKRTDGKVKNTQKYLFSIKQQDLLSGYFDVIVNIEELGISEEVKQMIENKIRSLTENNRNVDMHPLGICN